MQKRPLPPQSVKFTRENILKQFENLEIGLYLEVFEDLTCKIDSDNPSKDDREYGCMFTDN